MITRRYTLITSPSLFHLPPPTGPAGRSTKGQEAGGPGGAREGKTQRGGEAIRATELEEGRPATQQISEYEHANPSGIRHQLGNGGDTYVTAPISNSSATSISCCQQSRITRDDEEGDPKPPRPNLQSSTASPDANSIAAAAPCPDAEQGDGGRGGDIEPAIRPPAGNISTPAHPHTRRSKRGRRKQTTHCKSAYHRASHCHAHPR